MKRTYELRIICDIDLNDDLQDTVDEMGDLLATELDLRLAGLEAENIYIEVFDSYNTDKELD